MQGKRPDMRIIEYVDCVPNPLRVRRSVAAFAVSRAFNSPKTNHPPPFTYCSLSNLVHILFHTAVSALCAVAVFFRACACIARRGLFLCCIEVLLVSIFRVKCLNRIYQTICV